MTNLLDGDCAKILGVHIDVFTNKINETTYKRALLIISALLSDDEKYTTKGRKLFNLI